MKKNNEKELTLVTAYFNIGRESFSETYARGNDKYVNYFKFWARMKNDLIVYTQKEFEDEIIEIRDSFGLKEWTKVIVIDDIYSLLPEVYQRMCEIEKDDYFKKYRYIKNCPDNNAKYDYIMFLKSWCLKDSFEKKYIKNEFVAWIDFGFNHGGRFFSDEMDFDFTWKYDFEDKIYIAGITGDKTNKPVFHMIQSGEVFIQGATYIMPVKFVSDYYDMMLNAINSLLDVGFIDDDQTILYMAYLKNKEMFNYYECDWMMLIKKYGGKHLKLSDMKKGKEKLSGKLLYKYRVNKRNRLYLKGLKTIFLKSYLD